MKSNHISLYSQMLNLTNQRMIFMIIMMILRMKRRRRKRRVRKRRVRKTVMRFLFSKSTETDRNELKMNSISKIGKMRSQIMNIITTSCMIETLDSIKDSPLLKFLHFLILILSFQDTLTHTLLMKRKMMQQSNN